MKEEDIEKAAVETAKKVCSDFYEAYEFASGFKVGAYWHINSVWHKAEERPERKRNYIAQCKGGRFIVIPDSMNWNNFYRSEGIIRWAYIEDLLPNTEE